MLKKYDKVIATIFALLTIVFIVVFLTNDSFFEWTFVRHHNILSWYMRPLFIVPMVSRAKIVAITLSYFFNIGLYLLVSYKKCAKSMSYKLYS